MCTSTRCGRTSGSAAPTERVRTPLQHTYVYDEKMILTASKLREDIYRLLDHVLATGEPIEIERNGRRLRIIADEAPTTLGRLVRRDDVVVGDSDDFVHLDWSGEWRS